MPPVSKTLTTDRVHFASASLDGYRWYPSATPSRLDMEGCADHRLEACTARLCGPRTGSCGSCGCCPRSEEHRRVAVPRCRRRIFRRVRHNLMAGQRATGRALAAYRIVGVARYGLVDRRV